MAAVKIGSDSITSDRQRSASLITAQLEIEKHKGILAYNPGIVVRRGHPLKS